MKKTRKIISLLLSLLMMNNKRTAYGVNSFAATNGTTGECTWTLNGTELTISGNGKMKDYRGDDASPWGTSITKVVIENGVTNIGYEAFRYCTSLTSITIPDSVTSIGDYAFGNCTSLTSVIIPNSVTEIGNNVFSECTSLTSITIPDSVTGIGVSAFFWLYFATSVTIGSGVSGISTFVFAVCTSLTEINVSGDNANFSSENGVLFNKEKTELITYPSGKTEPEYIVPDGVTSVYWYAFRECSLLTSITIPKSVNSIKDYSIMRCNSLMEINVSSDNANYCSENGVLFNKAKTELITYPSGKTEPKYIIPDSVRKIGDLAFKNCTSLKSIIIPESITEIKSKAFGYYNHNDYDWKIYDFEIYGKAGSEAERYAKENMFKFYSFDSIVVSKLPDNTEYYIGDSFDPSGIKVDYINDKGLREPIEEDRLTITGFDSSAEGDNTITVEYDGKTTSFDLYIETPSVYFFPSEWFFTYVGEVGKLTEIYTSPSNKEITWKSSDESVATIENGIITTKGEGHAIITATITVNGAEYSKECDVYVTASTMDFSDVRSDDWYYNAVQHNFERGYITGYSNGTFRPSNNIQRQDFVLILARIAGADLSAYEGQNGGFSDVQTGSYYASAVAWAKDTGVANGFSADNFGVGTFISREQICIMLCRYLNGSASGNADTILNAYPDGGNTSPWAKAGVAWAVENGIIGNSDYLNPNGNAGRAEVGQIIYNMSNNGIL